ncbi:MAG: ABC transporter permease [Gammaproteobacteria bacterium]
MNIATQTLAVAMTNLRNIPHRLGGSLVIVIGIAGVVGVLIPVLAMSLGFQSTVKGDGRADRAVVLTRISTAEYESSLSHDDVARFMNAPEVRRDAHGEPVVSAEVVLVAPVARKGDHSDVNVTLRGVGGQYFTLRPELKLIAGRMYRPGNLELVIGAAARSRFDGVEIGDRVRLQDGDWTVVGTFAGGNGSRESEAISDAQTVMSAYKLSTFNSLTVALNDAASFASFRQTVLRDTKQQVDARTEPEYLASASSWMNRMLHVVAYSIGAIMALGALFSALNSTYSAVAARAAEMATLRAIGFSAAAVAIAVLIEAMLLALVGAAIGVGVSYALFEGATISMLGGAQFDSQLVYALSITPALAINVMLLACALGLAGALVPAIRVARSNIADTLHET